MSIEIFARILGFIYFWVFFPLAQQSLGLWGAKGISPISTFFKRVIVSPLWLPSIYWINQSDKMIQWSMWGGTFLSILLVFGVYPPLLLFLLLALHLSIITAGQEFMGFGWESLFFEIGVITFFLTLAPNFFVWWVLNFLLFRFMFEAGISKFESRDPKWRNLTAVKVHYLSQPLPNSQAWYAHKLPMWLHKASCVAMLGIEIGVPFLIFGTETMRLICFTLFVLLQLMIWFTGNFSYLNYLTVAFSMILLPLTDPLQFDIPFSIIGLFFLIMHASRLLTRHLSIPWLFQFLHPFQYWHLFNRYQLFSWMTDKRYEVIIEGSHDGVEWKEYLFKWKPSEIDRRPRRVAPYQPRLDWQAWFLPFSPPQNNPWFRRFLNCLLMGSPEVLKLLRKNPFPDQPPQWIRAKLYDYTYTTFDEKTHHWWKRTFVRDFV